MIREWNSLPKDIVEAGDLELFFNLDWHHF